jgi:pyruvate carboxylase subunit B
MMDRFREIVGPEANLQTLARGVNTVMLDTGSRELIDLHAKLFRKHGTTTIRNFDALNDMENLRYAGERIVHHGLKHEAVVTMMELPPGCSGAHDVAYYEKVLREMLDSGLPFDSLCFKDASGTSTPHKIYETIRMARRLLPEGIQLRLHTHETAGVSVAGYFAALDAGVDGIDLAASPVSGGTSQPDILTMIHAVKGTAYDLGGLEAEKILEYERVLESCLEDYFFPPEAMKVSPLIPFSPMPGGALTANTQMMRDNGMMDKFPDTLLAMREVVEKGGFGTSVTPVSQFYFQQALNNVVMGPWQKIAPGFGKMVLGYFGKTPVAPDPEVVRIASEQLGLEPTKEHAIDIADRDEKKSIAFWRRRLEKEGITPTEENIFIAASCEDKGIAFLKGEGSVNVRKVSTADGDEGRSAAAPEKGSSAPSTVGHYTVRVDGETFQVTVSENGEVAVDAAETEKEKRPDRESGGSSETETEAEAIVAPLPGTVWKIMVHAGDSVRAGERLMILESMKMQIDVVSPKDGIVKSIDVVVNDQVAEGQRVAAVG